MESLKMRCNCQAVGYAVRASMMLLGAAARVWRILHPCFLTVETTDLKACEDLSTVEGSEGPGDFYFDLHHPEVLFGQIVGEGHVEIGEEAQRFGFERFQPFEQVMAGTLLGAPTRFGFRLQFGQPAMESEV